MAGALVAWPGVCAADGYLIAAGDEALAAAVQPLAEHRAAEGLEVTRVLATEASAVLERVRAARPRFLLLVGDVDAVPHFEVTHPGSDEAVATDRPYGDLDGDGFPEVAVGRIPSSDPAVVARVAARIVAYEAAAPSGPWRRQCALVAGEGRFGAQADALLEHLFGQVVSTGIAPGFDVDLTYANPRSGYCYPAERFADRVVERLNEGALVYAYVGHGQVRSVDDLVVPTPGGRPRRFPVLAAEHVPRVRAAGRAPVMVAIACWTGRYEGQRPSIGEELFLADQGPIAFFGASRVSHPVHNGLLASELVRELLSETGEVRVGEAFDRAERAMARGRPGGLDPIRAQILFMAQAFVGEGVVETEMPRHVDMYNLLGDPALVLARPGRAVELEAPALVTPGQTLTVRGAAGLDGPAVVTVTLTTDRRRSARPDAARGETALERYARANDRVLATAIVRADARGRFEATLRVPLAAAAGEGFVKAFAEAPDGAALGAARVRVGPRR